MSCRNVWYHTNESLTTYSTAAPVWAAIISNLNSIRWDLGLPPMGFLNPFLYSIGRWGLTDIVHGGSVGCLGTSIYSGLPAKFVEGAGWNATEGWDPVTGLGTPVFPNLVQAMLSIGNLTVENDGSGPWRPRVFESDPLNPDD